jgi:hypothetical protein
MLIMNNWKLVASAKKRPYIIVRRQIVNDSKFHLVGLVRCERAMISPHRNGSSLTWLQLTRLFLVILRHENDLHSGLVSALRPPTPYGSWIQITIWAQMFVHTFLCWQRTDMALTWTCESPQPFPVFFTVKCRQCSPAVSVLIVEREGTINNRNNIWRVYLHSDIIQVVWTAKYSFVRWK